MNSNNNINDTTSEVPLPLSDKETRNGKETQTIRILIVDDQKFVLEMLQFYLKPQQDLEVVGTAESGRVALELTASIRPDIILVDVEMPEMDGLVLTQTLLQHFDNVRVIVLSSHDNKDYIRKALIAGAKGYLLKDTPAQELIHAIRFVHRGYLQLSPGLFDKLEDNTLKSIAQNNLSVSNKTVKANNLSTDPVDPIIFDRVPVSNPIERPVVASGGLFSGIKKQLKAIPQVWTRGLLCSLGLFAIIALPAAFSTKVDETRVARGQLEPNGATIQLSAKNTGTVAAVLVKEGDSVQKGQILLELESDTLRRELQQAQAKLSDQVNRLAQSELIKNQNAISLAAQWQQKQTRRLETQAQGAYGMQPLSAAQGNDPLQRARLLTEVGRAEATLNNARTNLNVATVVHQSRLLERQRYRNLLKQGAISKVKVTEVEQESNESSNALIEAKGAVRDAEKLLQAQRKTYEDLKQPKMQEQQNTAALGQGGEPNAFSSRQQLEDLQQAQLAPLKAEIKQTQGQIQSLISQLQQRAVRAPANGIVFQLPIKKAPASVQPRQLLAQIAPQGSPLVFKAQVPSRQAIQMKVGMPFKLKFDAYPFENYGAVPGRLSWISSEPRVIRQGQRQTAVSEIKVALDQAYTKNSGKPMQLALGQSATAETIVRQRRIIDFVLDPFKQLQKN
jgi:hemolysin D